MNDFSELERELKKLQPRAVSAELSARVEAALAAEEKIVRPARFQVSWLGLGLGLAAAAAFVVLARMDLRPEQRRATGMAAISPTAAPAFSATANVNYADYRAEGLTQVVYDRRDEGIVFPEGSAVPARRMRTAKRETFRWTNPSTGGQLRVSYPAEEVTLTPVSGQ